MNFIKKSVLLFFVFFTFSIHAQIIRKSFEGIEFSKEYYDSLTKTVGLRKKLPNDYQKQILQALTYFPELKNVSIVFRLKKSSSPLMVRPTVGSSVFRSAKNRTYIIFISSHSPSVDSILMKNLPLDAQIGVVGHELSHVSFFINQGRFGMFKVALGNLSWKYLDKIEFETDRTTVLHGLGYQLLVWSEFVRVKLKMEKWRGADEYIQGKTNRPKERYMNPETIKAVMAHCSLYK